MRPTPETNPNARLKAAVDSVDVPPFLEARIRNQIRVREPRHRWMFKLVPATAALAVCLGAGVAYQLGYLRVTASARESYIASVSSRVATLMRIGLGDHIHCAVFRKFPKNPPAVEHMESAVGPEFKELVPIVRQHVPENYKLMLGHRCRYHGREFVHFSLQGDSQLMSLMITRKKDGESFDVEGMLPALSQSGVPVFQSGVQNFQIAGFETRDHLVYFVSDLPGARNIEMLRAMTPAVKNAIAKLEL